MTTTEDKSVCLFLNEKLITTTITLTLFVSQLHVLLLPCATFFKNEIINSTYTLNKKNDSKVEEQKEKKSNVE